ASRQRGETALAFLPIARRGIEENLHQSVSIETGTNVMNVEFIRKEELDRAKTIPGCGLKTVKERVLPIHHGQVGSETWISLMFLSYRLTSSGRVLSTSNAPSTSIPASIYMPVRLF